MSLAFEKAGYDVLLGIDNWEDSLVTFEKNHKGSKILLGDISHMNTDEIRSKIGKKRVDVVVGGPPCQGFSISGKRNPNDPRNELYRAFVEVVKGLEPRAFLLETHLICRRAPRIIPRIFRIMGFAP